MRFPPPPRRSLKQIEAQLDRDRAQFVASMRALRRASLPAAPRGLIDRAGACVQGVTDRIAAHPLAFGLGAAALGWLALRRRRRPTGAETPVSILAGTEVEAVARWEDEGGPAAPLADPAPLREAWEEEADRLRARAAGLYRQIDHAHSAGLASEADLAPHRREILAALTQDIRAAMARGLEGLGQSAREAALAAREAAYVARLNATRVGTEALTRRPLATGAVLAATGAAAAYVLPQSAGEVRFVKGASARLVRVGLWLLEEEILRVAGVALGLQDSLAQDLRRAQDQIDRAAQDIVAPSATGNGGAAAGPNA